MKSSSLFISLAFFIISACSNNYKDTVDVDWHILMKETLVGQYGGDDNQLFLFISDNMCSECIIQEYLNINKCGMSINIIGYFNYKRNFVSSVNKTFIDKSIFIDRFKFEKKCIPNEFPIQPVYFIYDKKKMNMYEIFYPQPCNKESTYLYFEKIKRIINNSNS
ncbi:MAG: hypothetical protein GX638_07465 [Crenarchaeota archaeon]|nr:hypothetical protein [Thermoproteota archaeon]